MTENKLPRAERYEDTLEIPNLYSKIIAELRTDVQYLREKYLTTKGGKKRERSGNAAVAKLELTTGRVYRQEATSKQYPLNIPGQEEGPRMFFNPRLDTKAVSRLTNEAHAEYKIFNALAEDLERDGLPENVEGTLYLYTERDMCPGCSMTSNDFNDKFPNIKVIVFWKRPYPE